MVSLLKKAFLTLLLSCYVVIAGAVADLRVNDAGVWRRINEIRVNDAGTWRQIRTIEENDGGVWRLVFIGIYVDVTTGSGTCEAGSSLWRGYENNSSDCSTANFGSVSPTSILGNTTANLTVGRIVSNETFNSFRFLLCNFGGTGSELNYILVENDTGTFTQLPVSIVNTYGSFSGCGGGSAVEWQAATNIVWNTNGVTRRIYVVWD